MKVIRAKDIKVEKRTGGLFSGGKPVEVKILADETMGSKDFRIGIVTFPPGTRNLTYIHDDEQILYVLQGKGM